MLFREVPDAIVDVLKSQPWLDGSRTVTVVRALDGCVRLFIETAKGKQKPTQEQRQELESELLAKLGAWLGRHDPVWCTARGEKQVALVQAIHDSRKPWDSPATRFKLYRIERHAARHGWVGELPYSPPWSIDEADDGTFPPVVTFFSHKGGVGRSTALAATAIHLSRRNRRVLVIDLDLEAPGLGTLLADPAPTEPGLLDLLVGPEGMLDTLLRTVATPHSDKLGVDGQPIMVVKAGEVDEAFLELLARVDLHGARDVEAITERLRKIIIALHKEYRPDLILLDARTGFHDVGGVALGALSHGAVFLGLPNEQSWQGLRAVARMVASAGYDDDDNKPKVWLQIVHALAPPAGGDEEAAFQQRAYDVLSEHYYVEGSVPQAQDVPTVVLPYREALRGGGDQLTPRAVEVLSERPWQALAEAVAWRYDHLLDPDGDL